MELFYIWQKLKSEKARIFLTIFAIAWGTLTISLMLAVTHGFLNSTTKIFERAGANTLHVFSGETSKAYQGTAPNMVLKLRNEDFENIREAFAKQLAYSSPSYSMWTKLDIMNGHHHGSSVLGVGPDFSSINNIELIPGGRFINSIDVQQKKQVMVVSNQTAVALFGNAKKALNQLVFIQKTAFKVIGVTAKTGKYDYHNRQVWIPDSTMLKLYPSMSVLSEIQLAFKHQHDVQAAEQRIRLIIAKHHQLDPKDLGMLNFYDSQQSEQAMTAFYSGLEMFFSIVGILTLLAASLGITSMMLTAVKNDQTEIGLRMALGSKTSAILRYYLLESGLITALGGLAGLILSFIVIALINRADIAIPMLHVKHFKLALSWPLLFSIILILAVIGLLAAFFPARKASQVNPARALSE